MFLFPLKFPCSSNPCQNGGACVVAKHKLEMFECICKNGYSGEFCEKSKFKLLNLMQDLPLRCMSVKYLQIFLKFILWLKQPLQNFIHVFFPTPGHSSSDGTK